MNLPYLYPINPPNLFSVTNKKSFYFVLFSKNLGFIILFYFIEKEQFHRR